MHVADIGPKDEGICLQLKVLRSLISAVHGRGGADGADVGVTAAVVGDATGCIVWMARGEQQLLAQPGKYIEMEGAHVRMVNGHMYLFVGGNGSVRQMGAQTFEVSTTLNVSNFLYGSQ